MLLEILSNATAPSGFEGQVRNIIKEKLSGYVDEIKIDRLGNVIAHKKGKGKKVLLDAHMDEVGFIITGFNEDGTLRFSALGAINSKIIPSKVVLIGKDKIPGVVGFKPIHLQSKEERENHLSYNDCCIDIGANSRDEAKKQIQLGEFAIFDTEFAYFGEGLIKGKAFDDRMGCGVLIEVLKDTYDCDLYAAFNVQEEVGSRGAFVAAYNIKPDIGIAIEGTICADMPTISKHLAATELGKGPVISIMDKTSIANPEIVEQLAKIAKDNNIDFQYRKAIAGGNDAGAIQMSGEGAKVATLSIPCRYIHSSVSVASIEDYENTIKLLRTYLKTII